MATDSPTPPKRIRLNKSLSIQTENIDELDHFNSLPDEVILRIFSNLRAKDLFNTAQVCKRFDTLSRYKNLWKVVHLKGMRLCENTLKLILKRRVAELVMTHCFIVSPESCCRCITLFEDLHLSVFKLIYTINVQNLTGIVERSSLKEFVVCGFGGEITYKLLHALSASKDLQVLHFTQCGDINCCGWKELVQHCDKIKELQIGQHHSRDILSVIKDLPKSLCKLTIEPSNWCYSLTDENVSDIVSSCVHLQELNLPFSPRITGVSLVRISDGLKWLKKLNLNNCGGFSEEDILKLNKMENLIHLIVDRRCRIPRTLKSNINVQLVNYY